MTFLTVSSPLSCKARHASSQSHWQAEVGCDERHGYEAPLMLLLVLTTCYRGYTFQLMSKYMSV